jgi:hypothetical protein
MKFSRILCTTALLGLALGMSAAVVRADGGSDPKLNMGGGTGSPNCFGEGGASFQGSTGITGTFASSCVNNGPVDIDSFSFQILAVNAPGGITPTLDNLLAPFAGTPLAFLDWTVATVNSQCPVTGGVIVCTASQSAFVADSEASFCAKNFNQSLCSQASMLTANQMEKLDPLAFLLFNGNPCADAFVYVTFGVVPGCDVTVGTVTNGGSFVPDSTFDTVLAGATPSPLPEPSSLSLLFLGLGGLPFLRRKLAR